MNILLPRSEPVELLTPSTLNATVGDHFTGIDLDAKWTRSGLVAGDHTYRAGGGSWMRLNTGTATGINRTLHTPWTVPTNAELVLKASACQVGGGHPMWGPYFCDNTGAGIGFTFYSNGSSLALATLVGHAFSATAGFWSYPQGPMLNIISNGPLWLRLRKAGTSYFGSFSCDGLLWGPETPSVTNATAMTRVGFGLFNRFAGVNATEASCLDVDFFNAT